MKTPLIVVIMLSGLTGCASRPDSGVSRTIGDTAAALGGAAIGYVATDGDTRATVGGAVAGFGVKRFADHLQDKAEKQKLQLAYDTAHAHATRELYEAIQRQQAEPASPTEAESVPPTDAVYLPTQIPERVVNGVILEPTVEYIRITDTDPK